MATYTIKQGHILTLVTDALTTAKYFRVLDPNNTVASSSSLSAGSTATIGPFTNDQRWSIDSKGNGISITDSFYDLSNVDELLGFQTDLGNLTGIQADTITDIGNSATGTQIATAVNAIIAALIAAGIVASS